MRVSIRFGLAKWIISAAMLSACASGPTIRSHSDPSADFSRYKTFDFFKRASANAPYESFATQYITTAIVREMEARGFQRSDVNPNLLINFHIERKDKVQVTESPSGYYGYRSGLYGWGSNVYTSVDSYTEGTLNIDVVDLPASKLLWEGIAVGRITDRIRQNPQPVVDEVVKEIFTKFPVQP